MSKSGSEGRGGVIWWGACDSKGRAQGLLFGLFSGLSPGSDRALVIFTQVLIFDGPEWVCQEIS